QDGQEEQEERRPAERAARPAARRRSVAAGGRPLSGLRRRGRGAVSARCGGRLEHELAQGVGLQRRAPPMSRGGGCPRIVMIGMCRKEGGGPAATWRVFRTALRSS